MGVGVFSCSKANSPFGRACYNPDRNFHRQKPGRLCALCRGLFDRLGSNNKTVGFLAFDRKRVTLPRDKGQFPSHNENRNARHIAHAGCVVNARLLADFVYVFAIQHIKAAFL